MAAHGLQGFLAAHGLQAFVAAHGLQAFFFFAAHGLHGLQAFAFFAAHGLQAAATTIWPSRCSACTAGTAAIAAADNAVKPKAVAVSDFLNMILSLVVNFRIMGRC